jgi:hypothetical protein
MLVEIEVDAIVAGLATTSISQPSSVVK